jgi:LCP family protein required for cell wall assembly
VSSDWSGTTGEFPSAPGGASQPEPAAVGRTRRARSSRSAARSAGRKRHRWARRTGFGVVLIVVVALILGGAGWFYLNYRIGQIPRVVVPSLTPAPAKAGDPFNILLVGSDSRSFCVTAACQAHLGDQADAGGQRSDVIIILRVVPATRKLEMLSIPRDTFVTIARSGGTENKINSAFNTGPDQLVATIEQDFHIPINHFAYANFNGFTNAMEALGGVYLDFPDPIKDDVVGLNVVKTGCQLVTPVQALKLVRSRDLYYEVDGQWEYDGLGDLSRIRRQQAFFHAVILKADTEDNPLAINAFVGDAVHDVQLDSTFTPSGLLHLALEFRGIASANLSTEVLPTSGAVYNGSDILLPVWNLDNAMIKQFLAFGNTPPSKSGSTSSTSSTTSTTTTTTSLAVTGTTTVPIIDNSKNYPEPWNPVPCSP